MSRTRRFLGGVGLGYVSMAVTTLVGLWLTRFYIRVLGSEEYGLWLIATQIINYLMLTDLGVVAILPRQAAWACGAAGGWERARELPRIAAHAFQVVLWQLPLLGLLMAGIWAWLPAEWSALREPLGLVFVFFVVLFPLRIPMALLTGLQDLAFTGGVQLATWLVNAFATVLLLRLGRGLDAFAVGYLASQGLSTAICLARLVLRFPGALPRRLHRLAWPDARELLGRGFWVLLTQISHVLLAGTDLLVIGKILGPAAVVGYSCTAKLFAVLQNQPQMLMQSAAPGLSELRTSATRQHLFRVSASLSQAMLLGSGLVATVVLAVNGAFVGWWVGPSLYGGLVLTALLAAQMLVRHWNDTVKYALFAFGRERFLALTALLDGLGSLGASVVLVYGLGAWGAPAGSIAGAVLLGLAPNLRALAQETGAPPRAMASALVPWLWRFLLLAAAAALAQRLWVNEGLWAALAAAAAFFAAYVALLLPVALREPLGDYLRPRLFPLLRRLGGALGIGP